MERKYWNPEMETLPPGEQRRLEQEKLLRQLEYVAAKSEMYRRKWSEAGTGLNDINGVQDLAKMPFTTKAELRESQERRPPFGDFLACAPEDISRVHRTSGATGRFIYTALTKADLDLTHDCGARSFWSAGLRPHHRVIHCLNYQLWMGGVTDHVNLETTGATVFPFGVGNSRQLVRVIREAGINAISSTPSYPKYLEQVVRDELGIEPRELGLALGLFGGEPGLDNPVYRKRIEDTWGMTAQNANYGVSDVLCNFAAVCEDNYQLHFLGTGALLFQLIDPESGEDLPMEEGVMGEMVLTHLAKEAQPLVRYRTSDLLEVLGVGPCACGRTGPRFRVIGRADNMLHVKGINVFPNGVARVLESMVPDVTGEFQIVLSHPSPYTHLDITVEQGEKIRPEETEGLKRKVIARLKEELNFKASVTLVPPGSIERTEMGKAIRVLRTYSS
ncbi:MAG: phenylacetate--CoA ligase family protein [Deltaproteobacteria bacterium]|nr:phenylacetate--CoA ligase family protein [Deltaproteobacteria bacterium]